MWIDIGFLLFAMYGLYLGFKKGIIRTLVSLASIFVGVILALKISPIVIAFAQNLFKSDSIIVVILGFLATYFAIIALIRFLGRGFEKLLKKIKLNFINKTIGGALLSIFFVFIFSIIVWFFSETGLITESDKDRAVTYPILEVLPSKGQETLERIKPYFREFWELVRETTDLDNDSN